jgi:hypothetical protein
MGLCLQFSAIDNGTPFFVPPQCLLVDFGIEDKASPKATPIGVSYHRLVICSHMSHSQ